MQVSSKGMLELSRSWKTIPPIKLVRLPRQRRSSHIRPYPRVSSAPTSTFSRGKCDPRALFLVPCIHHGAVKKRTGTVDDITTPAFVTSFHILSWNFHGTAKKNQVTPSRGWIFHDIPWFYATDTSFYPSGKKSCLRSLAGIRSLWEFDQSFIAKKSCQSNILLSWWNTTFQSLGVTGQSYEIARRINTTVKLGSHTMLSVHKIKMETPTCVNHIK